MKELKSVLACLLLIFNACSVFGLRQDRLNGSELVFTSIIYRHGERNPEDLCPNDQHQDASYWPDGLGMLTVRGKLQHYILGKWLRQRYESLIPGGRYYSSLIYVQSSDTDRSLMSALANLAGMFPPTEDEKWSDLNWQPIPVHTIPGNLDKLISVHHPCPKIIQEFKNINDSPLVKRYNRLNEQLYANITTNCGKPVDVPIKVASVYQTFVIENSHNYKLPDWASGIYPDTISRVGSFAFQMRTMSDTLKRLRGGPILKDTISHMKDKRDGTLKPNRNFWVYSGHDTTVAAVLDTMRVFKPHVPPFAATIMIELRKDQDNQHYVSVYYKTTSDEPELLTIPGCDPLCPLDKFESLLSNVIPDDWDAECKITVPA